MDYHNNNKIISVPVALKGGSNYLLWSRLVKTAVGRLGLWSHITDEAQKKLVAKEDEDMKEKEEALAEYKKWVQDDLMVQSVLQASLEVPLLESYSYCETPKHLWETLQKTFGIETNLSRVFELKGAINSLVQDGEEFTKHLGKYISLWSELESLRPNTMDQEVLAERREQNQVFGLLMTLDPPYKDVIAHILRSPSLPTMEEVFAQLQKEEGISKLSQLRQELKSSVDVAKVSLERRRTFQWRIRLMMYKLTEICAKVEIGGMVRGLLVSVIIARRQGHKKSQCWILHPHLKPPKFNKDREARAHFSAEASGAGSSGAGPSAQAGESEGKAMTFQGMGGRNLESEMIRRSDIESLIKALNEHGNTLGNTLGYSYTAHMMSSNTERFLETVENAYIAEKRTRILHRLLEMVGNLHVRNESPRTHIAQNLKKPLIIDSGASHHMISDTKLIKDIEPAHGHVMIANGDRIPLKELEN
ncbi:hypothetical protein Bca4012_037641 [Brassica carinata]